MLVFIVKRIELNQFGRDPELSLLDPISKYIGYLLFGSITLITQGL